MFQRYKRCNWEIEGNPEDDEDGKSVLSYISTFIQPDLTDTPPRKRFYDRVCSYVLSHFQILTI